MPSSAIPAVDPCRPVRPVRGTATERRGCVSTAGGAGTGPTGSRARRAGAGRRMRRIGTGGRTRGSASGSKRTGLTCGSGGDATSRREGVQSAAASGTAKTVAVAPAAGVGLPTSSERTGRAAREARMRCAVIPGPWPASSRRSTGVVPSRLAMVGWAMTPQRGKTHYRCDDGSALCGEKPSGGLDPVTTKNLRHVDCCDCRKHPTFRRIAHHEHWDAPS